MARRIQIGDSLPDGVLRQLGPEGPEPVSIDALFDGRRVALFSVPGAFTPKSTLQHVPSFLKAAPQFRALGIDEIICLGVNDAHVMSAWAAHCQVGEAIRMLADGQCEYFTSLGMEMDCCRFAIGWRCQRFSLLAENRIITRLNVEEPGQYSVSDAGVLLSQLHASADASR